MELMEEAVQTRTANGMKTILRDVWDGLDDGAEMLLPEYNLLIASPPCQTFSMAGNGSGRKALDEVIEAIRLEAYKRPEDLKAFGELHDDRTALVLTPLAYIWRDRPKYVALEQVPTVLPVWEACAEVMREWGYEVKTAILHAEQYGVPQTRKRAILVAKLDAYVDLPTPTHSKYYPTNPTKLDPGVQKWVSMAEALGWSGNPADRVFCPTNMRPHAAYRSGENPAGSLAFGHENPRWITPEELEDYRKTGSPQPGVKLNLEEISTLQSYPTTLYPANGRVRTDGGGAWPRDTGKPAPTVTGEIGSQWRWNPEEGEERGAFISQEEAATLQSYPSALRSNYGTGGDPANRGERTTDQPAPTVTSKADRNKWDGDGNMTAEEAAALQSYPTGRGLTDRPSPTIVGTSGNGGPQPLMKFRERLTSDPSWVGDDSTLTTDEAATLQTYPTGWGFTDRPAVTVAANVWRGLAGGSGGTDTVKRAIKDGTFIPSPHGEGPEYAQQTRITYGDAGALQTYERPFVWKGTKTKIFLQIGNAVPPLLAQHVLTALLDDSMDLL